MRIIGIDVGRQHTGVVSWNLLEKKVDHNETINISLGEARSIRDYNSEHFRNNLIASMLVGILSNLGKEIILASVEDYIYGDKDATDEDVKNRDRSPLQLAETHGVILAALAKMEIPVIKPSASLMKYFVTGFGHSEKVKMIKAIWNIYKTSMPDEHQYDALCAVHVARYFVAYCISPSSLKIKTYERNAMNQMMFDHRFHGVADEVRTRYLQYKNGGEG